MILRHTTQFFLAFLAALLLLPPNHAVAQDAKDGKKAASKPAAASSEKPAAKKGAKAPMAKAATKPPANTKEETIIHIIHDVSSQQVQQTIEKLVSFGNRSTLSVNNPGAATSDKGIVAARNWIKSEFERYSTACGGCLEVKTDTFIEQPKGPRDRITQPTEIQNVYAILRGTDPAQAKRIFLVTGHYDSRNSDNANTTDPAPGANDDGSGTAVSLECARVLSKHKFPATLVFLTVAGEEQGLNGSTHFAKMAKAEGWQLESVLNNDIVGGNKTPGDTLQNWNWVRVFSEGLPAAASEADLRAIRAVGGENDSASRQLARYILEVGQTYASFGKFTPKMIFRRDRFLRGGDHSAFNEQGFTAVRFTEYREDFNHQHQTPRKEKGVEYGDWPKYVNFDYVANVARLNASTLATLASAPTAPNAHLLTKELENDSKIEWDAVPGAVAYDVLWRKTTDPDFPEENAVRTAQTKIDLQDSKDNVIFGVRSVGAKGQRSLIAIPAPERTGSPVLAPTPTPQAEKK